MIQLLKSHLLVRRSVLGRKPRSGGTASRWQPGELALRLAARWFVSVVVAAGGGVTDGPPAEQPPQVGARQRGSLLLLWHRSVLVACCSVHFMRLLVGFDLGVICLIPGAVVWHAQGSNGRRGLPLCRLPVAVIRGWVPEPALSLTHVVVVVFECEVVPFPSQVGPPPPTRRPDAHCGDAQWPLDAAAPWYTPCSLSPPDFCSLPCRPLASGHEYDGLAAYRWLTGAPAGLGAPSVAHTAAVPAGWLRLHSHR